MSCCLKFVETCVDSMAAVSGVSAETVIDSETVAGPTDEMLMELIQKRDEEALTMLYYRHGKLLKSVRPVAAEEVAAWLRRVGTEELGGALTVLGPAPCPISRLKGRWRWHVLIKATEPRAIGHVVRAWGRERPGQGTVVVDRDPVTLL